MRLALEIQKYGNETIFGVTMPRSPANLDRCAGCPRLSVESLSFLRVLTKTRASSPANTV